MSEAEIALFQAALKSGGNYLEYGAGRSTGLAVREQEISSITTVDADSKFLEEILNENEEIRSALESGRLRPLLVDIGPVGEWSFPRDRSRAYLWPNYALCPYRTEYRPDLVLADGRFRIACCLLAVLQAPEATILIHDFTIRPRYHVLKPFLKIEEENETLVRCRALPEFDQGKARRLLREALYFPDDRIPVQ